MLAYIVIEAIFFSVKHCFRILLRSFYFKKNIMNNVARNLNCRVQINYFSKAEL